MVRSDMDRERRQLKALVIARGILALKADDPVAD
jgi:hypothetical protein